MGDGMKFPTEPRTKATLALAGFLFLTCLLYTRGLDVDNTKTRTTGFQPRFALGYILKA
jgi:hypothetical protein